MKNLKKILSLVLALAMALSLMTVAFAKDTGDFADGDDVTYAEAVDVMATAGIFNGTGDGTNFDPNGTLTREQAAKIITYMLIGQTQADKLVATIAPFADVSADRWSAGAIAYCASEGIMNGTGNGKFNPTGELTGLQFAKMLLVALGYDAEIEDMTGAAWGLATSKLAYDINLDDGLASDVSLTNVLTREQAAQMAFTTMKTPMVQYADKGTTIEVNGATVSFGAKQASYRTSTVDKGQTISTEKLTNNGGYLVEFAERHCTDLRLKKGADDFGRPADIWTWKSEKIGTYADEADATYTKKVKVGDIYKDLGLGINVPVENVTVYVDGVENDNQAPVAIKKASEVKYGDNGVLTQVYYDDDKNTAIITEINTWTGTISRSVAASGNKDAYVIVATESVKPAGVGGTENFETNAQFDDDVRVLYTYSQSADAIIDVDVAESVSGIVTRSENNNTNDNDKKALTIDGTRYASAAQAAGENVGDVTVKNDYTIYLDAYGYLIYVEETDVGIGNYALLMDTAAKSDFVGKKAELLFTDGTTKVVTTDKDYSASPNLIADYTIVTFRVDSDDVYSLRAVDTAKSFKNADGAGLQRADDFVLKSDKAGIKVDVAAKNYAGAFVDGDKNGTGTDNAVFNANSATAFVVADAGSTSDFSAYTGIKNAPSMTASANTKEDIGAYWFCKSGKMITVMFVFPNEKVDVEDGNTKLVFIAKDSVSNLYHDADGDYYEYNAIIGDEIKANVKVDGEVKVDGALIPKVADDKGSQTAATKRALNGLYKGSSVDKYGVITNLKSYAAYTNGSAEELLTGTGIDKTSKDYTLILDTKGANETITADENCKYYYVDKDGVITTSSYRGVAIDDNDLVYAVVKDYMVKVLVIEEVENEADKYSVTIDNTKSSAAASYTTTGLPISNIEKGASVTFTVAANAGYELVGVTANNALLTPVDGKYTIPNITRNVSLVITTKSLMGDLPEDAEAVLNSNGTAFKMFWKTGRTGGKPAGTDAAALLIAAATKAGYTNVEATPTGDPGDWKITGKKGSIKLDVTYDDSADAVESYVGTINETKVYVKKGSDDTAISALATWGNSTLTTALVGTHVMDKTAADTGLTGTEVGTTNGYPVAATFSGNDFNIESGYVKVTGDGVAPATGVVVPMSEDYALPLKSTLTTPKGTGMMYTVGGSGNTYIAYDSSIAKNKLTEDIVLDQDYITVTVELDDALTSAWKLADAPNDTTTYVQVAAAQSIKINAVEKTPTAGKATVKNSSTYGVTGGMTVASATQEAGTHNATTGATVLNITLDASTATDDITIKVLTIDLDT